VSSLGYRDDRDGIRVVVLLEEERARAADLERALVLARREARHAHVMGFLPAASVGSLVGTVTGAVAWGATGVPFFMAFGAAVGFFFGAIVRGFLPDR
jgi:uncharacterized membrane protein